MFTFAVRKKSFRESEVQSSFEILRKMLVFCNIVWNDKILSSVAVLAKFDKGLESVRRRGVIEQSVNYSKYNPTKQQ